jgi:regulator of replication initiation timing
LGKVGSQFTEIHKLQRAIDLKNSRIDKMDGTLKREVQEVNKLQDEYQRLREILSNMLDDQTREFRESNFETTVAAVDKAIETIEEVKDDIRPIRFRRSKNGESQD